MSPSLKPRMSVCVCVCVCVCAGLVYVCAYISVYTITQNNSSINLKLKHLVVYENICNSENFNIGHCLVKVKVMARPQIYETIISARD